MTKPYLSRLPCEIIEASPYAFITDLHPETGKPYGMRQKQIKRYCDFEEEHLDQAARERSNEMQAEHQ